MEKKAVITREYKDSETIGKLELFDDTGQLIFSCVTLELPWLNNARQKSCIPEGAYNCVILPPNNRFKYPYYYVQNVKGRSEICIHRGNFKRDTAGCILIGKSVTDFNKDGIEDISDTVSAMSEFTKLAGTKFTLEIYGKS